MTIRRLAVLLVTSHRTGQGALQEIGSTDSAFDDLELVDYVELLSGTNIPFDIIHYEDINVTTFYDRDLLRYAIVIFAVPLSSLSDAALATVRDGSFNKGISLLASYTQADGRSKDFFGIEKFRGGKCLWPLKARIIRWPRDLFSKEIVVDYGLSAGLLGIRKRGFTKISIRRTMLKGLKILKSLILLFVGVKLDQAAEVLATTMSGRPLVWSFAFGKATNYYVGLRGDLYLDKFNEMHQLIRALVESNSGHGMVSADLEGTMALRLDDPGACVADYLDTGGTLEEDGWGQIGNLLRDRGIPLSIMYTPGWVDNGDKKSGTLFIDNKEIHERSAGNIYDSHRVTYIPYDSDNEGCDHSSEFRGLKKLVEEGLVDIHSHGRTHLTPDYDNWANAEGKINDAKWFHEFYHVKYGKKVPEHEQSQAMLISREKIHALFGQYPCVLTPSGHRHDAGCDLLARDAGYRLFSSDYTGILKDKIVIRNWKIPALFLYLKDPTRFVSKTIYPMVGVIHDYDIKQGLAGFENILDRWTSYGIGRFITMSTMTVSLCSSLEVSYDEKNSLIKLSFTPATCSPSQGSVAIKNESVEVHLRFMLPEKMVLNDKLLSLSDENIMSVKPSAVNHILNIMVILRKEQPFTLQLPLHSIGRDIMAEQ